jgi:hypothetical protein
MRRMGCHGVLPYRSIGDGPGSGVFKVIFGHRWTRMKHGVSGVFLFFIRENPCSSVAQSHCLPNYSDALVKYASISSGGMAGA